MKKAVDRRLIHACLAVALCGFFTSGCTHTGLRRSSVSASGLPDTVQTQFHYARPPEIMCQRRLLESTDDYTVERVKLLAASTSDAERWIDFDYYAVSGDERRPVIMVLPMLGGGYSLERHFAAYFARRGYASMIVHRDRRAKVAKVEQFDRLLRETVMDHRQVIDWIEQQPELDGDKVGIFGISMGGIKGALLIALESRIKAAALGLAGGDLPYILTHTTEPGLVKRRNAEMETQNITLAQAEERLREAITCDPIRFAQYVDPKKVLLVLARFDTVVPIEKGLELKEKMGNPETIMLPSGHYTAALSIPYIKAQTSSFFEKRFRQNTERQTPSVTSTRR